jgi:hypothetical protein
MIITGLLNLDFCMYFLHFVHLSFKQSNIHNSKLEKAASGADGGCRNVIRIEHIFAEKLCTHVTVLDFCGENLRGSF